jgi:predicted nucleic acid-binding protein
VPPHFQAEVVTAVRRAVIQGRISLDDEDAALDALADDMLPDLEPAPCTAGTWRRAVLLARRLCRANVYDTLYLAVAEEARAEYWTADGNLVRALEADGSERPKWVHLIEP